LNARAQFLVQTAKDNIVGIGLRYQQIVAQPDGVVVVLGDAARHGAQGYDGGHAHRDAKDGQQTAN
jgi:hypothetical protein